MHIVIPRTLRTIDIVPHCHLLPSPISDSCYFIARAAFRPSSVSSAVLLMMVSFPWETAWVAMICTDKNSLSETVRGAVPVHARPALPEILQLEPRPKTRFPLLEPSILHPPASRARCAPVRESPSGQKCFSARVKVSSGSAPCSWREQATHLVDHGTSNSDLLLGGDGNAALLEVLWLDLLLRGGRGRLVHVFGGRLALESLGHWSYGVGGFVGGGGGAV